MPKNKHRKPPPSNVEERRARAERVVHREDMTASLGEVLEHEHVDEAIELLYKQDELGGNGEARVEDGQSDKAPQFAQSDTDAVENIERVEAARVEEEPTMSSQDRRKAASEAWNLRETTAAEEEADAARVKRSVFRFVSPVFMLPAAWHATADMIEGARRAWTDLRDAAKKARRSFA